MKGFFVIALISTLSFGCMCSSEISESFISMNKSINADLLVKIPAAISTAVTASETRRKGLVVQSDRTRELLEKEKENKVQYLQILHTLKKDIQVIKEGK